MAQERLAHGADGIKVYAGAIVNRSVVLPMDPDIIRAAVEVAHAAGKPVFAHPSNHAGTDKSLAGGVDVLVHTIPMEPAFTSEELARMKPQHVALIPTISLFPDEVRKAGGSEEVKQAIAKKRFRSSRATSMRAAQSFSELMSDTRSFMTLAASFSTCQA